METSRVPLILRIPELFKAHVRISDPSTVYDKLIKIQEGGKDNLHIIADFDHTLTKLHVEGNHYSSIGALVFFEAIPTLTDAFKKGIAGLMLKFLKLSNDSSKPFDDQDRLNTVEEIWKACFNLLIQIPIKNSSYFDEFLTERHSKYFREGTEHFVNLINANQVPISVVSGGFVDTIKAMFKFENIIYDNIQIIANTFIYKDGYIRGVIEDPPVHPYNKHLHLMKNESTSKVVNKRCNVIVMGDSITDSHITDDIPESSTILKIGFVNDPLSHEGIVEEFMELFDIVIIDNESLATVNEILKFLIPTE